MAQTSSKQTTFGPDLEAVNESIRRSNERLVEATHKATGAYLDGVERYVAGVTQVERKLAEQTQVEAVASFITAHAKLTDDVAKASISAAREFVAA